MLTLLRIKNLALVVDVTLEFRPGFNAITGETGAGKSILIGAISLALGERADRGLIRSGADSCTVEATFDLSHIDLRSFLLDNGLEACEGGLLIVKRTLMASGVNRQFINGSPTTLNVLATLGNWLVDIHGPYDHQSLLRPAEQLRLLDGFGKCEPLRNAFADVCRRLSDIAAAKAELIIDDVAYVRQLELLRHQVAEISAAELRPDEESELQDEFNRTNNAARILDLGQNALGRLADDEESLLNSVGALGRLLMELNRIDPTADHLRVAHAQVVTMLGELKADLDRYVENVTVDPARLQQLEERLNLLQSLKRKYGHTLSDVVAFGQKAARELELMESRASRLAQLDRERRELNEELRRLGGRLTANRQRVIPALQRQIADQLAQLGFGRSHFEIALVTANAAESAAAPPPSSVTGYDQIEFLFAPNPGEPARPLRAIASSGEMARVMLALKTVLAAQDAVPVLVFDEVDANIGGETARTVGLKMREIGRHRQVLCVTHLAPVAACAAHHFVVSKVIEHDRTNTSITPLEGSARVHELARMLGGTGAAALEHARVLIETDGAPAPPRKPRSKAAARG
jgi:DNA repair protein RecN (Recombination protein N)